MIDEAVVHQSAIRNFTDLDTDGDGALTRNDYITLAQRRLDGSGVSSGSPQGRAVLEAFAGIWDVHVRAMDADRDGQISEQEYVSSFATLVRAGTLEEAMASMLRATFDLADREGNGILGEQEFRALWSRPDANLSAAFSQADADGDGRITFEEYADVRRRLLLGDLRN